MEYAVRFDAEYAGAAELEGLEVAGANSARAPARHRDRPHGGGGGAQRVLLDGKPGIAIRSSRSPRATPSKSCANPAALRRNRGHVARRMAMTWVSDESASVVESVNAALSSVWQAI